VDIAEICIKTLADSIKGLLARFADHQGVSVKYHKTEPRILFSMVTQDRFVIEIDYDINSTSKEYIHRMVGDLLAKLEQSRQARHSSPIIIAGASN
jgi:hypothetical protein